MPYIKYFLDSTNIFAYAAYIRDNMERYYSVNQLKREYYGLILLRDNYDKIKWVS